MGIDQKQNRFVHVTFFGDSAIDNRLWVDGYYKNILYTKLGIAPASSQARIKAHKNDYFKPELSVIENLETQLSDDYVLLDATNDGFTSKDILQGNYRDKLFKQPLALFPHVQFKPLEQHAEAIQNSDIIVLSVGSNDLLEFLDAVRAQPENLQTSYIQTEFPNVLQQLANNYVEIIKAIRKLNASVKIIAVTQYYPSAVQNDHKIYDLMRKVGAALNIGPQETVDPMRVIQHVITQTLGGILNKIKIDANLVVADITSSLNPMDSKNHLSQIVPSGIGGRKIAKMLQYLICNDVAPSCAYRFTPVFFDNMHAHDAVVVSPLTTIWQPLNPVEIDNADKAYLAAKPIEFDWYFVLKAGFAFAASGAVIALLGWYVSATAAVATTIGIGVAAGIAIGTFFSPRLKGPTPELIVSESKLVHPDPSFSLL